MRRRRSQRRRGELRGASERLRRALGLLSGDDLVDWLATANAGPADWERWLRRALARRSPGRLGTARMTRAHVRAVRRAAARRPPSARFRAVGGPGRAAGGESAVPRPACGAVALAEVARHHGVETPSATGSTLADLAAAAQRAGLDARALKVSARALGRLPTPAVVHVSSAHWVVLRTVTRAHVELHDPATGPVTEPRPAFEARWTGWALVVHGRRPRAPGRRA